MEIFFQFGGISIRWITAFETHVTNKNVAFKNSCVSIVKGVAQRILNDGYNKWFILFLKNTPWSMSLKQ